MAMNDDKGASSKSADYSGVLGISVKRQRHFIHLTEMGDWLLSHLSECTDRIAL